MGDYNQNYRSGGGRGGSRYGGRDFGRSAMHKATCAECGNSCEVPFRPSGDRPIYCSSCFEKRRNENDNSRGPASRNFGRPKFEEKRSYSGGGDRGNTRGNDNTELIEQLKSLNFKMDNILRILEPKIIQPPVSNKEVIEKIVKPKAPKIEVTDIVFEPKTVKSQVTKKKGIEENI